MVLSTKVAALFTAVCAGFAFTASGIAVVVAILTFVGVLPASDLVQTVAPLFLLPATIIAAGGVWLVHLTRGLRRTRPGPWMAAVLTHALLCFCGLFFFSVPALALLLLPDTRADLARPTPSGPPASPAG